MLDTGFAEADFGHPRLTIGAGVIKAAPRFDEHVQTHQQAERIRAALIVDEGFVNNERAVRGQGVIRLAQ